MIPKKGDVFQIFYLLIIVFIVAVLGLFFYKLTHEITSSFDATGVFDDTPNAKNVNTMMGTQARVVADEFVFLMFLGSMIALLIAAARTNFNPTVIFIFILLLVMAILCASGLVNIYQGLATSDSLIAEGSQLNLTNIILSKYTPLIICVLGGVVLLIMYGKSGGNIAV